jgi:hypothetical protein
MVAPGAVTLADEGEETLVGIMVDGPGGGGVSNGAFATR